MLFLERKRGYNLSFNGPNLFPDKKRRTYEQIYKISLILLEILIGNNENYGYGLTPTTLNKGNS